MNNSWFYILFLLAPILIHLFSFRRARHHLFSTLKFVRRVKTQSKSRSRIKHLLVLTSRLFVFLSVVYLIFESASSAHEKEIGSLLIDSTPSMSLFGEEGSAEEILSRWPSLSGEAGGEKFKTRDAKEVRFISLPSELRLLEAYTNLISDFQGISLDELSFVFQDSSVSKNLFLVDDLNSRKNIYVDTLTIDFNSDDLSKRQVIVYLDRSESLVDGTAIVRLLKDDRQLSSVVKEIANLDKVVFDIPIGLHGEFIIELEGDNVLYDNSFRFVVQERSMPVISLVDAEQNRFLQTIYENNELFISHKIDPNAIDYELLSSSDVIILNSLKNAPSGLLAQISEKTVVIFPDADNVNDEQWSDLSFKIKNDSNLYELDVDFQHPLFKGVFDKVTDLNDVPSSKSLGEISGNFETIISLRNGDPFLVKHSDKNHFFFNTNLSEAVTNFPTHSLFLPLLYKIALLSSVSEGQNYFYPGDLANETVDNQELPPKIISSSFEIIPEFGTSGNGITWMIPALDPGFYTVINDDDSTQIAINMPKGESLMRAPTLQELQVFFRDYSHVSVQSLSSLSDESSKAGLGVWKYALILIIFLLMTETLFHKYLK